MRKKNGFISMSIIYSFFTVFILVSTSLLLIYSNNLSIVKTVNREIKEELTTKGNNSLMVFKNLIVDGSFEHYADNWIYDTTLNTPIYNEQRYYGSYSLGMIKSANNSDPASNKTLVQSVNSIHMIKDHYYYISRIYLSYNDIQGEKLTLKLVPENKPNFSPEGAIDILGSAYGIMAATEGCGFGTNNIDCLYGNRSINRERWRYQSGFCLGVNGRCNPSSSSEDAAQTQANTFESGVFHYILADGDYRLLIGADFTEFNEAVHGILPRFYTDGYMLIDLTVALQLDEAKWGKLTNNQGADSGLRIAAGKIDSLLDGRFIENQKTIPINKLNLE